IALLIGAVFTIPVGLLVDRFKRVPMLAASVVLWSLASLVSAFASDYSTLLLPRLALGAVTATAGHAIASLTGDYFPAAERGSVASLIDWRAPFVLLAIPGFFLARMLWRTVPEPRRGGQSRLAVGATSLGVTLAAAGPGAAPDEVEPEPAAGDAEIAYEAVRARGVEPDPDLILTEDPQQMPLGRAVRYVLRIPSIR